MLLVAWRKTRPASNEHADLRIRVRDEYNCLIEAALAFLEGDHPANFRHHETPAMYHCSRPRQVLSGDVSLVVLTPFGDWVHIYIGAASVAYPTSQSNTAVNTPPRQRELPMRPDHENSTAADRTVLAAVTRTTTKAARAGHKSQEERRYST